MTNELVLANYEVFLESDCQKHFEEPIVYLKGVFKRGLKLRDMRISASGQIFTCNRCNKIHFEFSTIAIDFLNIEALKEFLIYLKTIDAHGFEKKNRHNNYRRKIAIPFPDTTIRMMLSVWELMEMIELVKDYIKHDTGFVSAQNDFPDIHLN